MKNRNTHNHGLDIAESSDACYHLGDQNMSEKRDKSAPRAYRQNGVYRMKYMKKITAAVLVAALLFVSVPVASAIDLGDILKDAAIIVGGGAVVKALGPQLNDFINTLTFNKNAKYEGYTKVVPIVSFGDGTAIGAAQIGGQDKAEVDRTQAVARLEGQFNRIGLAAMIPIDALNPLKQFKRVQGVGVTAIIDVKL